MRVIPVLDLLRGRAVWARRGERAAYAPVRSCLTAEAGDAVALAVAFRRRLGCDECYVADLDAIMGGAVQVALLERIAAAGGAVLLDAGAGTVGRAREAVRAGAARVVVGLETLASFDGLAEIVDAVGADRVAFSLDLRGGRGVGPAAGESAAPLTLAAAAVGSGVTALLVLDLARIGTGTGLDLALLAALRRAHPTVELLAGGGVASIRDLEGAAGAGCDGALVASALHDGTLDRASLEAIRRLGRRARPRHVSDSR